MPPASAWEATNVSNFDIRPLRRHFQQNPRGTPVRFFLSQASRVHPVEGFSPAFL
jgi:hypothetical protein